MVGSADAVTRQCLVKYALSKMEWKDKLVGLEDERMKRAHRVLERLIAANHLEKGVPGGKWEVMVVDTPSDFLGSTRVNRTNEKPPSN